MTFCFQVFLDTGNELPPLTKKSVTLALQSRDPEIVEVACKSLPNPPNIYNKMTSLMWWNFFSSSDLISLNLVISQLLSRPVLTGDLTVNEIINGTKELLNHPRGIKNISELTPVALLYLRYISKNHYVSLDQSSRAHARIIESIASVYQFRELDDIYMSLIRRMNTLDKLSAYLRLIEQDSKCKENIRALSEMILDPECMATVDEQLVQLGMECFKSRSDTLSYYRNSIKKCF